jgi:adenine-specific DNA-methyltransferase
LALTLVELVWDRKYDKSGVKSAPLQLALPFQTIETLNESSQQRQKSIDSFLTGRGQTEWRNRLIWGDKKYVLPSLLPEFANSIDLIYIDPPFDTGEDFSFLVEVPDHQVNMTSFTKLPSMIEQKAYRDTWGVEQTHLDSYLRWSYETLIFLGKLLKTTGSIYVHLDYRVSHYVKAILDEIFGPENFVGEIIWKRRSGIVEQSKTFGASTDTILLFSKSENYTYNRQYTEIGTEEYVKERFKYVNEDGRRYRLSNLVNPAYRPTLIYEYKGYTPPPNGWAISREKMEQFDKEGRLFFPKDKNQRIQRKQFLDEWKGKPVQNLWDDIYQINPMAKERLDYPTQKPEALLERIIKASSNEGDLVLDCFCGSGTTAAVAEKLGRRWIACDLSRFAIHTTRKRLLGTERLKPFVIQNLGKYERQAWQTAEFGNEAGARVRSYIAFILKLYNAQALNGYIWLHGKKGSRLVHVGSVDSPISPLDVGQIVAEFKRFIGTGKEAPQTNGIDVLGWDFAFELNELAKQQAAQANVDVRFLRIPREVLDKRAVEQGDVRFFELACLDVGVKASGKKATVTINDFVIPADDVPADVQKEIKHWSQWIDYWAIDWNNKNDTFHNEWQEYRTREKPKLVTESSKTYDEQGEYHVVVKVVDILGNDTTKMLQVKAK